ncbi:hypothetical protein ACFPIJ_11170 [Dactylosporangium cerinum]|uniref:Uncharacterized protein n=1 Tax=Dactylosporangium cerinum TaxID=1434730 RepID=A0ABV9VPW3_9ACTN
MPVNLRDGEDFREISVTYTTAPKSSINGDFGAIAGRNSSRT